MSAKWESIRIGDQASFAVVITDKMVLDFVKITGDDNPLHTDQSFARAKGFPNKIVHGLFLTALFSRLAGKYFLGDDNFYLSQTVKFKKPVLVGEKVTVAGRVVEKIESIKSLTIQTTITRPDGEIAATGQAEVKYL